jgi:DNA-binding NarL/FixJ family response regulator
VLIIDDHEMFRGAMRALLDGEARIEVVGEAEDGETGIRLAGERPADVALIDLALPDMSGLETVAHIRARRPGIAVVLMTGTARPGLEGDARDVGVEGVILKTAAPDRWLAAILGAGPGRARERSSTSS